MNRKSVMRRRRKDLLRWSNGRYQERVLNLDMDDKIIPDKKRWGYCVECYVNGYSIGAPDRTRYEAIYAAWDAARWCLTRPSGENFGIEEDVTDIYEKEKKE